MINFRKPPQGFENDSGLCYNGDNSYINLKPIPFSIYDRDLNQQLNFKSPDLIKSIWNTPLPTELVADCDDCDETRAKLIQFMKSFGIKPFSLAKLLGGDHIKVRDVNEFLQLTGQKHGNHLDIYPFAYIFLEKLRVYLNHPKSASRTLAEERHPEGFLQINTTKVYEYVSTWYNFQGEVEECVDMLLKSKGNDNDNDEKEEEKETNMMIATEERIMSPNKEEEEEEEYEVMMWLEDENENDSPNDNDNDSDDDTEESEDEEYFPSSSSSSPD